MSRKFSFVPTVEALETRDLLSAATPTLLAGAVLGPAARSDGRPVITLQREAAPAGHHRGGVASQADPAISVRVQVGDEARLVFWQTVPCGVPVGAVKIDWKDGSTSTVARDDRGAGAMTLKLVGTDGVRNLYELRAAHVYEQAGKYVTTFSLNGTGTPTNVFTVHVRPRVAGALADIVGRRDADAALARYFAQAQRALPGATAVPGEATWLGPRMDLRRN